MTPPSGRLLVFKIFAIYLIGLVSTDTILSNQDQTLIFLKASFRYEKQCTQGDHTIESGGQFPGVRAGQGRF